VVGEFVECGNAIFVEEFVKLSDIESFFDLIEKFGIGEYLSTNSFDC